MKPTFTIGDFVKCTGFHTIEYKEDAAHQVHRVLIWHEHEFEGWIVGAVWRATGLIKHGTSLRYWNQGDEYERTKLIISTRFLLWKVAETLLGKPKEVCEINIKPIIFARNGSALTPWQLGQKIEEKYRKQLSEESKSWKRDEKGRWIK